MSPNVDQKITLSVMDLNIFKDTEGCFDDEKVEIYQGPGQNEK